MEQSDKDTNAAKEETRGTVVGSVLGSLRARLIALVILLLLPMGVLSIAQAITLAREAESGRIDVFNSQATQATVRLRNILNTALIRAESFAATLGSADLDASECAAAAGAISATADYSFVGVARSSGLSVCNDGRQRLALSDSPEAQDAVEAGDIRVFYSEGLAFGGEPALVVSAPVPLPSETGSRSVLISVLAADLGDFEGDDALGLATFNNFGEILTGSLPEGDLTADALVASAQAEDWGLEGFDGNVGAQHYTMSAIIPGRAFVFATASGAASTSMVAAPLLIWVLTLGAAILALRDQVNRPILSLKSRMQGFADRRLPDSRVVEGRFARDFDEIYGAFQQMTIKIIHDEADLENKVRERGVLLQEIHHRVKNNLQLISSIINMQMRNEDHLDPSAAMRAIQRRLQTIARFHDDLYQNKSLFALRADKLLRQLVTDTLPDAATTDHLDLAKTELSADQASHLAMFVAEALLGATEADVPDLSDHISMTLTAMPENRVALSLTLPTKAAPQPGGITYRLLNAFAQQLSTDVEYDAGVGETTLRIVFEKVSQAVGERVSY